MSEGEDGINWVKSSYSGGSGSDCVEAGCRRDSPILTLIRDSKATGWGRLTFPETAWEAFTAHLSSSLITRHLSDC